jgi:sulfur-oxidizing protein SoxZ
MTIPNIKPRVRVPRKIKKGDIFEVKTLVTHDMESGQRPDKKTGKKIPREIINKIQASYNGKLVLDADWHPAVSANPYTSFYVVADKSGTMEITWIDDNGAEYKKSISVKVIS